MSASRRLLPSAIVVGLVGITACASDTTTAPVAERAAAAVPMRSVSAGNRPADHYVIELKTGESADFAAAVSRVGGQIERRLPDVRLVVVRGLSTSGASALASRGDVAHVALDTRRQWIPLTAAQQVRVAHAQAPAHVDQSGAFFYDFQWNMRVTKADQAWLTTPQGRGARVYVLDTGIDPNHIDLAGHIDLENSVSFSETEPGDIRDFETHGTYVSAIIASNGIGVASVAPLATITAVKVLDKTGMGTFADLISGIVYAANQRADVINMSLGAFIDLSKPDDRALAAQLQAAIAYARARGAVVVAAAGNDGLDLRTLPPQIIQAPAELLGVVSVGATAPVGQVDFDRLASYSNFGWNGAPIGGVQLFAPGGDFVLGSVIGDLIISACSEYSSFGCEDGASYIFADGTSVSAPMVSGEAAVLRSIVGNSILGSFVSNNCVLTGTDAIGPKAIFGEGRMNVVKAARCARGR